MTSIQDIGLFLRNVKSALDKLSSESHKSTQKIVLPPAQIAPPISTYIKPQVPVNVFARDNYFDNETELKSLTPLPLLTPRINLSVKSNSRLPNEKFSNNPFCEVAKLHGEVVIYRNDVYVPTFYTTRNLLQSNGQKRYLQKLGNIRNYLLDSKLIVEPVTLDTISTEAEYYYVNKNKPPSDLLRFKDSRFRRQTIIEYFKNPFYLTTDTISGSSVLSPSSNAIAKFGNETIAFSSTPQTTKTANDVTANSFNHSGKKLDLIRDTKRIWSNNAFNSSSTGTIESYIPSHIIEAENQSFCFPSTILSTSFSLNKFGFQLLNYPCVVGPSYKHFFVFADNSICFAGNERFVDIGMQTGVSYKLSDPLLGHKLARVIAQGLENLTRGYNPKCNPVNRPYNLQEFAVGTK